MPKQGIFMKFITDEDKDLNENDLLQTKPYADSLKKIIMDAPTPFNIGLYGEWGSGKSSIIKTVQNDLKEEQPQKIKFVVYDAWKYANDSFRRMFLKTLQQQLRFDGTEFFNSFYQNETRDETIEPKLNLKYFLGILLISVILIICSLLISKDSNTAIFTLQTSVALIAIFVAFFKNAFTDHKITISKPMIFAPEQFEEAFNNMMSQILKKYNIFELAREYVRNNHCVKDIDKLVIVVDNIDRCDKKTAYELLTNIKNFVGTKEGIIFLIPVDDEALKRHIQEYNKENTKEADEFLRKFFNVTLKIKHFQSRDLFMFANDINTKYELDFKPDTINIIAKEYASNPRRIIQLFNNLSSELQTVQNRHGIEFVNDHQSLIAKLLIIREEWSDIFKIITTNPHLLDNLTILAQKLDPKKDDTSKILPTSFMLFMEQTRAIKAELIDIEKIILNITNESTLPQEILSVLETYHNDDELKKLIQDGDTYKKIVEYVSTELHKELDRHTYATGVHNVIVLLCKLNRLKELDKAFNKEINGFLYQQHPIAMIMDTLSPEEWDNFYYYVDTNYKQKLPDQQNIIIDQYIQKWVNNMMPSILSFEQSIYVHGLYDLIQNCSNIESIKKLSSIIDTYNSEFKKKNNNNSFSKLKTLKASDELVKTIIEKMTSKPNAYSDDLQQLSRIHILSLEHIETLFQFPIHTNSFNNPSNLYYLLKNIQIESTKIPKQIDDFISQVQTMSHLDTNEEFQQTLLKCLLEIFRITNRNDAIRKNIELFVTKFSQSEEPFYKALIGNNDFSVLYPFFDYLIEKDNISNPNLSIAHYRLFIKPETTNSELGKITQKIHKYIDLSLSKEESKENIRSVIVDLYDSESHPALKTIISDYIINKDFSNITSYDTSMLEFVKRVFLNSKLKHEQQKQFQKIMRTIRLNSL